MKQARRRECFPHLRRAILSRVASAYGGINFLPITNIPDHDTWQFCTLCMTVHLSSTGHSVWRIPTDGIESIICISMTNLIFTGVSIYYVREVNFIC